VARSTRTRSNRSAAPSEAVALATAGEIEANAEAVASVAASDAPGVALPLAGFFLPARGTIIRTTNAEAPALAYPYRRVVEEGADLAEVADELGAGNDPGRVWLAVERAKVVRAAAGDDRYLPEFAPLDPERAVATIVALRERELLSWGSISARTEISEGSLRKAFRAIAERSERVGVRNSVAVRRAANAGRLASEAEATDAA
jgi:hypothetical protein